MPPMQMPMRGRGAPRGGYPMSRGAPYGGRGGMPPPPAFPGHQTFFGTTKDQIEAIVATDPTKQKIGNFVYGFVN